MIIEGLLTTTDSTGAPHVAPMGPIVDPELQHWTLRPFQSSTTFKLLQDKPTCIFHVVDDALMIVQAVLGISESIDFHQHASGDWLLPSACHWYRLQITDWDTSQPRSEAQAIVESSGINRPFWGWNRAKHAILEATILVTRLQILERPYVIEEFGRMEQAVQKTAGPRETQAWQLLNDYLAEH